MNVPLHIEVSELADEQIREADRWWRENRPKAPNAVREELERIGALIALRPQLGARALNVSLPAVRRIYIERIHCFIYYRVIGSPQYLEIVAFWGSRRETGPPI